MAKLSNSKHLILGSGVLLVLGLGFYFSQQGEEISLAESLQVTQQDDSFDGSIRDASKAMTVVPTLRTEHASEVHVHDDDSNSSEIEDGLGFFSVEELLDNIEDPRVQRYIESLPDEAQESIYVASLKQSVSKRLDEMEGSSVLNSDAQTLFEDLDTLSYHGLMMPGEVEGLKAYIRARL